MVKSRFQLSVHPPTGALLHRLEPVDERSKTVGPIDIAGRSGKNSVAGFSLIEIAVVLALVSLLTWLAVPRYSAQQEQGYETAMRLELLACVQTLQGLELNASPLAENPWLTLADGDGDGTGDQASGRLAAALCPLSPNTTRRYDVQVEGSELGFVLGARPLAADSQRAWRIDHLGRQTWHADGLTGSDQ